MPLRKPAKATSRGELEQFSELYEVYAVLYGDPVEFMFRKMVENGENSVFAAKILMEHRYPKVKAAEVAEDNKQPQLTMNIVVQQNVSGRAVVDAMPRAPILTLPSKKLPEEDG